MDLSSFETAVMAKGYEFNELIKDGEMTAVFHKDGHTISYQIGKSAHSEYTDTVVSYTTNKMDEYNAIKKQKSADPAHPDINHFLSDDSYITHVYIDGHICVHFRNLHHDEFAYVITVLPDNTDKFDQYCTLKGEIKW